MNRDEFNTWIKKHKLLAVMPEEGAISLSDVRRLYDQLTATTIPRAWWDELRADVERNISLEESRGTNTPQISDHRSYAYRQILREMNSIEQRKDE